MSHAEQLGNNFDLHAAGDARSVIGATKLTIYDYNHIFAGWCFICSKLHMENATGGSSDVGGC